jgi:F-type H+-transporting ATPase subunit b
LEFSWTTFILEIVNFLILVWLLTWLLYRPIKHAIATRRAQIDKALNDAANSQKAAEALEASYRERNLAWERDRAQARRTLEQELAEARAAAQSALKDELDRERQRAIAEEERQLRSRMDENERIAVSHAMAFLSKMVGRLASPSLEASIVDLAVSDLGCLASMARADLCKAASGAGDQMTVTTAYLLDQSGRRKLQTALTEVVGRPLDLRFEQDPALQAGLRIDVGELTLGANLQAELRFFDGNEQHA